MMTLELPTAGAFCCVMGQSSRAYINVQFLEDSIGHFTELRKQEIFLK